MSAEDLRRAGLEALCRELGSAGMVRFMQQFELGKGDYTAERSEWLDGSADVDAVMRAIEARRPSPATP